MTNQEVLETIEKVAQDDEQLIARKNRALKCFALCS